MNKNQKTNLYAVTFSLVYGIVLLIMTSMMDAPQKSGQVGADFLPRVIAILIIALSIGFLATTLSSALKTMKSGNKAENTSEKQNVKRIIITMALLVAYVALMNTIGFVITTIIYLFLQMVILGNHPTKKDIILYAVIAVVVPIVVNYVFVEGFQLLLPEGILG